VWVALSVDLTSRLQYWLTQVSEVGSISVVASEQSQFHSLCSFIE
jgi:hypothetical protein